MWGAMLVLRIRLARSLSSRHEQSCFFPTEDRFEIDKLFIPYSALNEPYLIFFVDALRRDRELVVDTLLCRS